MGNSQTGSVEKSGASPKARDCCFWNALRKNENEVRNFLRNRERRSFWFAFPANADPETKMWVQLVYVGV